MFQFGFFQKQTLRKRLGSLTKAGDPKNTTEGPGKVKYKGDKSQYSVLMTRLPMGANEGQSCWVPQNCPFRNGKVEYLLTLTFPG